MKKIFSILALALVAMTVSAIEVPTYSLTKADGAEAHGTITFKVGDATVTSAAEGDVVTVILTPATGWAANQPSGQWYAAIAAAPRRTGIDFLADFTFTPVEGQENQWTFTMQRANAEVNMSYKKLLTNTDISIADISALTYSGVAQTPTVTVTDGETPLVENTDYTVTYSNNTNSGTATVTIIGMGLYDGQVAKTFTILQAEGKVYFIPHQYDYTFGDPNFTPQTTVIGNGTLSFSSDDDNIAKIDAVTGEVTIMGVGKVNIYVYLSASANYNAAFDWYQLTVYPKEVEYDSGDVTQDENGYTVALTEDADNPNAQPLPSDADLAKLTYSRTLTAPGTGEGDKTIDGQAANLFTVCLPFAPKTDDAAKYYTLSGVSGETLLFDEVTTPAANTPYLVAVTGSVNFTEDCTDLEVSSMTINSSTVDGHTFTGTFTGLTNAKSAGKYILQKGNKWGKVTSEKQNVYIPPFRAFVEAPATAAPELGSSFDGNTTGIENIRTVDRDGTERWYDLNGRRIATPAKGINILNGKKVVVK